MCGEVDEGSEEDVVATADYHKCLLSSTLPQVQAEKIALEQFNVVLEYALLNRIMQQYACTDLSIEECIGAQLRQHKLV